MGVRRLPKVWHALPDWKTLRSLCPRNAKSKGNRAISVVYKPLAAISSLAASAPVCTAIGTNRRRAARNRACRSRLILPARRGLTHPASGGAVWFTCDGVGKTKNVLPTITHNVAAPNDTVVFVRDGSARSGAGLRALLSIVETALDDPQFQSLNEVDQTMYAGDASRPTAGQIVFKRFGLTQPGKRRALDIFDESINFIEDAAVCMLPIRVLSRSSTRLEEFHLRSGCRTACCGRSNGFHVWPLSEDWTGQILLLRRGADHVARRSILATAWGRTLATRSRAQRFALGLKSRNTRSVSRGNCANSPVHEPLVTTGGPAPDVASCANRRSTSTRRACRSRLIHAARRSPAYSASRRTLQRGHGAPGRRRCGGADCCHLSPR